VDASSALALDITARDLQKKDGQWTRAKGMDTFCPLGPVVVAGVDPSTLYRKRERYGLR
jgi:2-keto-4-pentenoate hydratase/2-oxohepta-3-ene-1,7-dioic acid hydratase in catechol pathway